MPRDKLNNGPVADRGCTDILCCLIFIAFIVVFVGVGGYGYSNGDPIRLLTTWDYNGTGCGFDELTKDYPYLYFPAIDASAANSAISSASSGNS